MFPFDQNNQQMYQNYAQAANTGDYSGIDPKTIAASQWPLSKVVFRE